MPRASTDFVPLPEGLRIPDGTGILFSGTAFLNPSGTPLVVSNSPEQIRGVEPVAVLSRFALPDWRVRLFYHHQNIGAQSRIAPFFVNRGGKAIEVYVARNSGSLAREPFRTADRDPAKAGLNALRQYFHSRQLRDETDRYVATVPPNGSAIAAILSVSSGECAAGMYDFGFRFAGQANDMRQPPALDIGVVTWSGAKSPTREQLLSAVATPDDPALRRTRGIYRHANRTGRILFSVPADRQPRWLDLSGPEKGIYARPLRGEFPGDAIGASAGQLTVSPGNYGVIYDLEILLRNEQEWATRIVCLLNLAGGGGGSVLYVDGKVTPDQGALRPAFGSHIWRATSLSPGAVQRTRLQFSLPGGASGAHRIYFWCQPAPGDTPMMKSTNR